jgi:UDP-GlcNAc:undecaprenyl-phosphate GlcNAc-1-phosphate transferase
MDGLAAGITTVASGFFLAMAAVEGLGLVASLAAATLGACIGFLYYNFNPASLFMGDAGSLLLGFVLAVLGIKLEFAGRPANVTWMIPVVILAMPIFDTTLVVISRLLRGKHIYQGGKDHTSHRLVSAFKLSQARAVMTLYMAAGALGLIAFMLRDANTAQGRIILAGLAALFVLGIVWLEWNFDEDAPPPIPES